MEVPLAVLRQQWSTLSVPLMWAAVGTNADTPVFRWLLGVAAQLPSVVDVVGQEMTGRDALQTAWVALRAAMRSEGVNSPAKLSTSPLYPQAAKMGAGYVPTFSVGVWGYLGPKAPMAYPAVCTRTPSLGPVWGWVPCSKELEAGSGIETGGPPPPPPPPPLEAGMRRAAFQPSRSRGHVASAVLGRSPVCPSHPCNCLRTPRTHAVP